jgi:hypothetical protein
MLARRVVALAAFASLAALASTASAEDKTEKKGTVVLKTIDVFGRAHRPLASVDVSRAAVKLSLGEPKSDFLARIEDASRAAPF